LSYEIIVPNEEDELEMIVNRKRLESFNITNEFRRIHFYPDQESKEKCIEKIDNLVNGILSQRAMLYFNTLNKSYPYFWHRERFNRIIGRK
jgi:hypothetical protein